MARCVATGCGGEVHERGQGLNWDLQRKNSEHQLFRRQDRVGYKEILSRESSVAALLPNLS